MQVNDDACLLDSDSDEGVCFLQNACLVSTKSKEDLETNEIVLDAGSLDSVFTNPDILTGIKQFAKSIKILVKGSKAYSSCLACRQSAESSWAVQKKKEHALR